MLYNAAFASAMHQHESAMDVHTSPPSIPPLWVVTEHQFELPEPWGKSPRLSLSRMILYTFPCYSLHPPHPSPHCVHKRDHSLRIPILRKSLPQTHLPDFLVSVFLHPLLLFTLKTKNKPTKTLRHTSQIILAPVLISQATEPLETEGHKNAGHLNCLSSQVENNLTASFLCLTTGRWHVKFSKSVHSFFFSLRYKIYHLFMGGSRIGRCPDFWHW